MKRLSVLMSGLAVCAAQLMGQYPGWINYSNGNEIRGIASNGDSLWVATSGGLARIDKTDGSLLVYNKTNSGLPSLDLTCVSILDTLTGNSIGVGTGSSGVVIKNGNSWTSYNTSNSPLPGDEVRDILWDGENSQWIATNRGLARLTATGWTVYTSSNSFLPDNSVTCLAVDSNGNLWIGTDGGGVALFDRGVSWQTFSVETNVINDIAVDDTDSPWIAVQSFGLARYTGTSWTYYTPQNSGLPSMYVEAVAVGSSGHIWAGTLMSGAVRFDGLQTWTVYDTSNSGIPQNELSCLHVDGASTVWAGTGQSGISRFDGSEWNSGFSTSNSGLTSNNVPHITGSPGTGGLWAGLTDAVQGRSRLDHFNGADWTHYNAANSGLPDFPISSLAGGTGGVLYVTTNGGGVTRYNGVSWDLFNTANSAVPDNEVLDADLDENGNLWISTFAGIGRYNGVSWQIYNMGNSGLPDNSVGRIAVQNAGNVWAARTYQGYGNVLFHFNGTEWATYDSLNSSLPDAEIMDLELDASGDVWAATLKGLVHYDGAAWERYTMGNSPLPSDSVLCVQAAAADVLWVGTQNGLVRFSPEGNTVFNKLNSGLPANRVNAITLDGTGRPWFATSCGLALYPAGAAGTPRLSFSADSLKYGTLLPGTTGTRSLSISNNGSAEAQIDDVRLAGPSSASFSILENITGILPVSESRDLDVRYNPAETGFHAAFLIIESNAESSPDTVILTGNAVMAELVLNPWYMIFGRVNVGNSKVLTGEIHNRGSYPLIVSSMSMVEYISGIYTLGSGFQGGDIAVGDSAQYAVVFTPQESMTYPAALVILSNSPTSPDTLPITGDGIQFNVTTVDLPERLYSGNPLEFAFEIDPAPAGEQVYLFFRQGGRSEWDSTLCSNAATQYQASLPASALAPSGLIYYIASRNAQGQTTYIAGAPDTSANWIPVGVAAQGEGRRFSGRDYIMFSVPFELDDKRIGAQLSDDLGEYNIKRWRLFRWMNGHYIEYSVNDSLSEFEPGSAYWIICRDSVSIDIEGAFSTPGLLPFPILLTPGWNQIANPFAFTVSWAEIAHSDSVFAPVSWRNGNYDYLDNDLLIPGEGYFVFNGKDAVVPLSVPPVEASELPKADNFKSRQEGRLKLPAACGGESSICQDEDIWIRSLTLGQAPGDAFADRFTIRLDLTEPGSGARDEQNFVGMTGRSREGLDRTDFPEAPPIRESLELSIVEEGIRFSGNWKALNDEGAVWDLEIRGFQESGEGVCLRLDFLSGMPAGFSCWLLDLDRGCLLPIRGGKADVPLLRSRRTRLLRLVAGLERFAEDNRGNIPLVPYAYGLDQNAPNPFNPDTRLSYTLAERVPVTLAILDVMGRTVCTLVSSVQDAGVHEAFWDGTGSGGGRQPSGVYFCRLKAGPFRAVRKMVLVR
ncbi:choice-of-anchor D domain-containing protein [bacterium]|nr:choice-of-anchor D domain-containing protein [bacterium]